MAPVLRRLRSSHVTARALAYKEAVSIWRDRGLEFEEVADAISEDEAAEFMSTSGAAALVVSTSGNSIDLERRFITAARRIGTPSLGLLDFWSNYVDRFGDAQGRLVYVPDLIAVMDETARAEMIDLGFDPERLVVTGQPAFDDLPLIREGFNTSRRRQIRHELGAAPGAKLVTFASQPMAAVFGASPMSRRYLGYTEHDVLRALIHALEGVTERGVGIVLAIVPHPREDPRGLRALTSHEIDIVVSRTHLPLEVLMAADLVVGMNSIVLMEASYLGCLTLSLQPGLLGNDTLPTNRLGVSKAVYDAADIDSAVLDLLLDRAIRRRLRERVAGFRVDGDAAERVAELIHQLFERGALAAATPSAGA